MNFDAQRAQLVTWLNTHRSATRAEVRRAGFVLGPSLGGKFRRTYPVPSAGAVIKFPRSYRPQPGDAPWRDPVRHSLVEIDTIERIRTEDALRHLRAYTAEVFFADRETGIVLMKAYRRASEPRRYRLQEMLLVEIFRESLCKWTADYGLKNLMRDEQDNPIVVDLGY